MDAKEITKMMNRIMVKIDKLPEFPGLLDEALGDVWNAAEHAKNLFSDDDLYTTEVESAQED